MLQLSILTGYSIRVLLSSDVCMQAIFSMIFLLLIGTLSYIAITMLPSKIDTFFYRF